MRRIHPLDPQLINQIAAGEVVERPASVLKELLENSLDAGASRIEIEVEDGGKRLIRVRDDGHGIHRDDLALALSRHATSKIASLDDLERVASLGFRGEALPSIASVSRLLVQSRTAVDSSGWQVRGDGSETSDAPEPVPHPAGTTIEVRDLFFNVPARRKFLRSETTEHKHVEGVLQRIALSRPGVELLVRRQRKVLYQLRPGHSEAQQLERMKALLGEPFVSQVVGIDHSAAGLRLHGWIAQPTFSRAPVLPGRAVPRPPSGLCAVPGTGSGGGGRQRPPGQARGTLPRGAPGARFPVSQRAPGAGRDPSGQRPRVTASAAGAARCRARR